MKRRLGSSLTALPSGWCLEPIFELLDALEGIQFWVKDSVGRYLIMNRGCLLDYSINTNAEVVGKTDFDLSPAYIASLFRLDDERVLAGERIHGRIELVGRYDHTAMWCITHKMPVRDGRGCIVGTAGIAHRAPANALTGACSGESMARALDFLRRKVFRAIANEELARAAGLSLRVFLRRFRESFGDPPQVYLRRLRVRMACHPLVYSTRTLADIALAHGFCDQSHFGREFRHATGMTPSEYRAQYSTF